MCGTVPSGGRKIWPGVCKQMHEHDEGRVPDASGRAYMAYFKDCAKDPQEFPRSDIKQWVNSV